MLWALFAILTAASVIWIIRPLQKGQPLPRHKYLTLAIMVGFSAGALIIYLLAGSWSLEGRPQAERLTQTQLPPRALAAKLENHLADEPQDEQAWHLLAALKMALGDYPQASEAYQRARALVGDQPRLLTGQAQAIIFQNDGLITQSADQLLKKSQQLQPDNLATLFFLGQAAKQDGKKNRARRLWRKALKQARKNKDKDWQTILQREITASKTKTPATPAPPAPSKQ